ncbi:MULTISPECIES: segregation/condensation protein A [Clostridium]|jgi:segregation and condensation protein A|uniref:Segregation and condensation protein A n=3 Tax=Clostridium butyricum TaxID=1492 RepID=C4IIQ9_CLOBU|nr:MULTISPECIES: segregation/condensation protein A [Clostridium]ETI90660.1 MAG: Segregation and condensation protein A [Clostridium butyricum DORA_1]ALP90205.1 segregation and condensation protein A [Clostridium butyricum]ALS16659.1 segregation and condensation protein A [Clostridium butyricum]ANF13823.1 segregation/condensation protein A [Clostridium butyricum]AOR93890.1 segregation/condensation protein A [Clostridium butyricum]
MELPKIKINDFEGPFDLLLHLIRKNQMSIYNVRIYEITNQYLNYLNEMKEMDLEITSEFIVVAATLIEIKSKHLLPKPKKEEENEEDVEKNLLEKLIIYKKIKGVSNFFKDRYISSGEVYGKKPEIIEEVKQKENHDDILKNLDLLQLYNIYNNLLEIYNNKQNRGNIIQKKIYVDKYKIEDKLQYIVNRMKNEQINYFEELIDTSECKLETIVTFLALLEMIKQRMVKVYQNDSFTKIIIERRNNIEGD